MSIFEIPENEGFFYIFFFNPTSREASVKCVFLSFTAMNIFLFFSIRGKTNRRTKTSPQRPYKLHTYIRIYAQVYTTRKNFITNYNAH